MKEHELFDVIIIGGGPAGLFSAFYSGLREMKTKIIEYQPKLGGKMHVYPDKMIWDVGGVTPIPVGELIERVVKQGLTFQPEVVLNEKVTAIHKNETDIFVIDTASGQKHFTKTIILAVGGGILNPTTLDVKHADKYSDKTLHYSVKSLRHFKNKTVLISGGGNAAIDWALELEPIAKKVYVSYRKDTFKGHEAQVTELLNSSITCCFQTSITRLNGNITDGVIKSVELTDLSTNTVTELTVDDVIINHGYEREAKLLKNSDLDIRLKEDFFIDGNALSESNIAGLYAAGDILKYDGKVHLIVGAFQDAVNAVNRAKQFIEKEAEAFPMVSSHNELLKERSMELMKQINE